MIPSRRPETGVVNRLQESPLLHQTEENPDGTCPTTSKVIVEELSSIFESLRETPDPSRRWWGGVNVTWDPGKASLTRLAEGP